MDRQLPRWSTYHLGICEEARSRSGETEGYCITFFHNFFALSPLFCSDCFSFGISRGKIQYFRVVLLKYDI
ncbi:hypothetical protein X798_04198, partial [Onchocerca flexuosa]